MARWIKIVAVCAALLNASTAAADQWLALTLAPDGAWGAAATDNVHQARTSAIAQCKSRSSRPPHSIDGCGALLRMARRGWGIAEICGRHWYVSVKPTLAEAETYLQAWKLFISQEYGIALAECRRVVIVGPDGNAYDPAANIGQ